MKNEFSVLSLGIFIAFLVLFSSCGNDDSNDPSPANQEQEKPDEKTITQLLTTDSDISILASILTDTQYDLGDVVTAASDTASTLTVFAPTNQAFTDLLSSVGLTLSDLTPAVVRDIVKYHVLTQEVVSTDLKAQAYGTLLAANEELMVSLTDGVKINDATVTGADNKAANGVVHKINKVLIPSEPTSVLGTVLQPAYFNKDFTTLVAAIKKSRIGRGISR